MLFRSMCNLPFHASAEEAMSGTGRKNKNLNRNKQKRGQPKGIPSNAGLNFGGQANELWCEGGEAQFIKNMILESQDYKEQVGWFTTLVSKQENLTAIFKQLKKQKAVEMITVDMSLGNKLSRFVAWRYS